MHFCNTLTRYYSQGAAPLAELCKEGRFVISNLRLLFLPPVDASVSKATRTLAWALALQARRPLHSAPFTAHAAPFTAQPLLS